VEVPMRRSTAAIGSAAAGWASVTQEGLRGDLPPPA